MDIIDSIKQAQSVRDWNDSELSRRLGLSQSVWSRIKHRQRPMKLQFVKAVGQVMPELQAQLRKWLWG